MKHYVYMVYRAENFETNVLNVWIYYDQMFHLHTSWVLTRNTLMLLHEALIQVHVASTGLLV